MRPGDVREYLDKKGFGYSERTDNFIVRVCPFCGDEKEHFYIHKERGIYHCFQCHAKGNLYILKEKLGDIAPIKSMSDVIRASEPVVEIPTKVIRAKHEALLNDPESLQWLFNRGFTQDTIRGFWLGLDVTPSGKWIAIPYFQNAKVVNIKYRSLSPLPKTFRVEPGHLMPLFNIDCIKPDTTEVWVTEGEMDCIAMVQNGYPNCVSIPLGSGSFSAEHYDALVGVETIKLFLDNTVDGQAGAFKIANRLGPGRCFKVITPEKDANDFFLKHDRQVFEKLTEDLEPFGRDNIAGLHEAFDMLQTSMFLEGGASPGIEMPWSHVAELTGPLGWGLLTVVTAHFKTGKSCWTLNIATDAAYRQGWPSLYWCLEMPIEMLVQRIVCRHRMVNVEDMTEGDIAITKADIGLIPLYFGTFYGKLDMEVVSETIRGVVKRFGVRLVVFDNLHFLCRSLAYVTQEVGNVTRAFKLLASELGIHVILIAQPRKLSTMIIPDTEHLRDSSSIPADADLVISLYRRPTRNPEKKVDDDDFLGGEEPTFEPRTLVRVAATRYRPGGSAVLYYDGAKAAFLELEGIGGRPG